MKGITYAIVKYEKNKITLGGVKNKIKFKRVNNKLTSESVKKIRSRIIKKKKKGEIMIFSSHKMRAILTFIR